MASDGAPEYGVAPAYYARGSQETIQIFPAGGLFVLWKVDQVRYVPACGYISFGVRPVVAFRCINNVLCSYSKYPAMKAQMPLMRAPFTNALLLIDNGLTNNKQNTFEPLLFIICQRPVVGGQNLQ